VTLAVFRQPFLIDVTDRDEFDIVIVLFDGFEVTPRYSAATNQANANPSIGDDGEHGGWHPLIFQRCNPGRIGPVRGDGQYSQDCVLPQWKNGMI
jgi:hypothetical protein